jgi:hypothetical protein
MKLGVIAASAVLGVVSFASASSAQSDGTATLEMSRTVQPGAMGESSRMAMPGPAPELEPARPAAGMLPEPRGPMRPATGEAANVAPQGQDIRNTLRRE